MKQIQIIENSDRFQVCINNVPERTIIFEHYKSKQIAYSVACQTAWHYALEAQQDGYEIKLLEKETK